MLNIENMKSTITDIFLLYPLHAFLILGLILLAFYGLLDILSFAKQSSEKY